MKRTKEHLRSLNNNHQTVRSKNDNQKYLQQKKGEERQCKRKQNIFIKQVVKAVNAKHVMFMSIE